MLFELILLWCAASAPFKTLDIEPATEETPTIAPWRTIEIDPEYGGQWVVSGDLDGDTIPEIVSAENFNEGDVHYTSAVVAQRLDGSILWKWGAPDKGRKTWHHDVACQIHDWDGDGKPEVIACDEDALVELDGITGAEKRRIPLPKDATDCLVFCDLSGRGRPTDVLVKNRYEQVWAYNLGGELLWTVEHPGGTRTAHQPIPLDIDGDGRDEILAGYALLNPDGAVRWVYNSKEIDLERGHLDCARVLEQGTRPEDWRIVMTFCGANAIVMADGNGQSLWEMKDFHFESINIGKLAADLPGKQIAVDIDHRPEGDSPIWFLDENGVKLGEITTPYSRHHKLMDWTGDGVCELVVAHNRALYNAAGARIATLTIPQDILDAAKGVEISVLTGEMNGDSVKDILLITPERVFVYCNPSGKPREESADIGTGMNVTLY